MRSVIAGKVRLMRFPAGANVAAKLDVLSDELVNLAQHEIDVEGRLVRVGGVTFAATSDAIRGRLLIRVKRDAIEDRQEGNSDDGVAVVERQEFEDLTYWMVPSLRLVLVLAPELRTHVLTPAAATAIATAALQEVLRLLVHPGAALAAPVGERPQRFFIDKVLQIAKSGDSTLLAVRAVGLTGTALTLDPSVMTYFNPDPDAEAIADRYWHRVSTEIESVEVRAKARADLSHNSLARVVVGSGGVKQIEEMTPDPTSQRRQRKRVYKDTLTDSLRAPVILADHVREVDAEAAALLRAVEEGDFNPEED